MTGGASPDGKDVIVRLSDDTIYTVSPAACTHGDRPSWGRLAAQRLWPRPALPGVVPEPVAAPLGRHDSHRRTHGRTARLQDSRVGGGMSPEGLCTCWDGRRACGVASPAERLHRGPPACVLPFPHRSLQGRTEYFAQKAESADDADSGLQFSIMAATRAFFFFLSQSSISEGFGNKPTVLL